MLGTIFRKSLIFVCLLHMVFGKVTYSERDELEFKITMVYKGKDIEVDSMGLRGNGFGLDWSKTTPMKRLDQNTWQTTIVYCSTSKGFTCSKKNDAKPCSDLQNGRKFRFRAVVSDVCGDETVMKGPVYEIDLPISRVAKHFEEKPSFTFYPFFFQKNGKVHSMKIPSNDDAIGTREMVLYLPPGYVENPKPVYDVMYMIDYGGDLEPNITEVLDDAYSKYAADAAVIGYGDYQIDWESPYLSDRHLITPYVGQELTCKEGFQTPDDRCDGCLPAEVFEENKELDYLYYMTEGGCGKIFEYGGKLDILLDYLLEDVYSAMNERISSESGSRLASDRESTSIIGYSWGGLATCYAAWTRPEIFGRAACESPSIPEPAIITDSDIGKGFNFINETLKTQVENRPRQQILLTVGSAEPELLGPTIDAANIMSGYQAFDEDQNLWLQVHDGHVHSTSTYISSLWNTLKMMSIGKGGSVKQN